LQTLWSVVYLPQHHDEDDDEEGGQLDDEVNLQDLKAGERLYKEHLRLSNAKSSTRPRSQAADPPMEVTMGPVRVHCLCVKSNGELCLAKKQRASARAARYPHQYYWSCNKANANVSTTSSINSVVLAMLLFFILFTKSFYI
jgi:hypothetical protein